MSARVLDPSEWPRIPGPFLPPMLQDLHPSGATVLVEERGGEIVATMAVVQATHLEGLWIDPAHRNAGVARSLMRAAVERARAVTPHRWAFAAVGAPEMEQTVQRLGAIQVPVGLWVLPLGKE